MKKRSLVRKQSARSAFTLLELVLVLAIIAALAGLVIPQIAMVGRSSGMAASARSQSDVANNIQTFFALQRRYPQGLDSLLVSTAAETAPTGVLVPQFDAVTMNKSVDYRTATRSYTRIWPWAR